MARLIDADKVAETIAWLNEYDFYIWHDVMERIDKLPTVNDESVKHGHNTNDGVRWFRCSECGWGMNDIYMEDESMVEDFDKFPYYCPYCGAKIDEVEDGIKQI